jgi:hypothetical protein
MPCPHCDVFKDAELLCESVALLPPEQRAQAQRIFLAESTRLMQLGKLLARDEQLEVRGGAFTIPLQFGPNTK